MTNIPTDMMENSQYLYHQVFGLRVEQSIYRPWNSCRFCWRAGPHDSVRDLLITPTSQPPTLRRYFLPAAYLMVNHDSNTFTMWQANPPISSNLVTVMSDKAAEACENVTGVVQPSATATTETGGSAESSSESSTQTPAGVIAGDTVGGLAFLAVVGLAVFFFLRRKRRQGESQPTHELPNEKPGTGVDP